MPTAEEKMKLFSAFESATDSVIVCGTRKDVCIYRTTVESSAGSLDRDDLSFDLEVVGDGGMPREVG